MLLKYEILRNWWHEYLAQFSTLSIIVPLKNISMSRVLKNRKNVGSKYTIFSEPPINQNYQITTKQDWLRSVSRFHFY